jgi:hypothetical protein
MAELQMADGQPTVALATYDEALSFVGRSEELIRRGTPVALLAAKAQVLGLLGRPEEAIVVLDGALSAIEAGTAGKAALRTRQAALASASKLDHLCALDRYEDAHNLGKQLSDVLNLVLAGSPSEQPSATIVASESSLAAELAMIVNHGECWALFQARERTSPAEAAERACRLYRVSEPWMVSATLGSTEPVDAAAALVQVIADGYALLAGEWSPAEWSSLPLPKQAEFERHQLVGQYGVEAWASEHGSPLALGVHDTEAAAQTRPLSSTTEPEPDAASTGSIRDAVKIMYLYELIGVLSQSSTGAEALRRKEFDVVSISCLRFAAEWVLKLGFQGESDGAVGVAVTCLLIARGFFVLAHHETGATPTFFSAEGPLREVLHETGGYAWLADHAVSLPDWTQSGNGYS